MHSYLTCSRLQGAFRPDAVVRPAERCVAVAAGLGLAGALAECPEVRLHACLPMPEKISRNRPGHHHRDAALRVLKAS